MEIAGDAESNLILNETTMTIHRQESGVGEYQTSCGHLNHVGRETLRIIDDPAVTEKRITTKCGQCFEEGGGY
jgi:hypothetical protein